jgi:GNAT superfamily N-acetyltransferase
MKPTDLEFVVPDQPNRADREAILTPLKAFNDSQAEPEGFQELAILLRDPGSGETVGGLWAKLSYDWLFVDLMFVPQAARSIGVGSQLLKRAEEIAIARGCVASGLTRSASRRAASTNEMATVYLVRSTNTRAAHSDFSCTKFSKREPRRVGNLNQRRSETIHD